MADQTQQQATSAPRPWIPSLHNYEADPRWKAIDRYTVQHLHPSNSIPSPAHLGFALSNSAEHGLRNIAVTPAQGKFLMLQARMLGAAHVLEVGTLGGYSTLWLAHANRRVRVTTVELSEQHAAVARENLAHGGVADRVDIELGAALDVLPRLRDAVRDGARPRFDMVFIDADKVNSAAYFDMAVTMCRPGACIVVDNIARRGWLVDEEKIKTDENVRGTRKTVESVGKDPRVEATAMQLVGEKNYDGILVAVVGEPESPTH